MADVQDAMVTTPSEVDTGSGAARGSVEQPKALSVVSTSASSDDGRAERRRKEESGSASQPAEAAGSADTNFQFSTDAAEFVPFQSNGASPFQFNPGASEFCPGSPGASPAGVRPGSAPQSPVATFVQVPMGAMPVYPVLMQVNPASGRAGAIGYVAPQIVTSPVGHMGIGFAPNMSYGDASASGAGGEERAKGSGKGSHRHRDGANGRGVQDGRRNAHGYQERRGSDRDWKQYPQASREEAPEEEKEAEEEEEDDGEPKKPSWADMMRASAAKKPEAKAAAAQALPKRVAKSSAPPAASTDAHQEDTAESAVSALPKRVAKSSGPPAAVPKAVSWGPKAEAAAPTEASAEEPPAASQPAMQEAEAAPAEAETIRVDDPAADDKEERAIDEAGDEKGEEAAEEQEEKPEGTSWAARLLKTLPPTPTPSPSGARRQQATPTSKAAAAAAAPAQPQARGAEAKAPSAAVSATEPEDACKEAEEEAEREQPEVAEGEEDRDEDDEDRDDDDEEEAAVDEGELEEKVCGGDQEVLHSESRQEVEPGQPDAGGVIRYAVAFLKSMATAPCSEGSCPASIPHSIRTTAQDTKAKQQRYGMKFLEQFKDKPPCQDLPENHRIPKDLLPKELQGNDASADVCKDEDDWRVASKLQKGRELKKSNNSGRGKSGKTIERPEPLPKLESSENSWASQQKDKKQDDEQVIIRTMKSILNKLTVEKFDTLSQQLLECGISTKHHTEVLMREVFEKATLQHHFIEMYTGLCIKLTEWFKERALEKDENGEPVSFRKILLNQCQDSFETYLKPPEGLQELSGEEEFEAKVKYKTKMIGNMKFVGQLLINKALSSKIIFQCTQELFDNKSEETLETLYAFLMTIGPEFDNRDWRNFEMLNDVFKKVAELSAASTVPARIRCLLKDVLDLRANNWQGHRPSKEPEGPKRMSDVKQQWEKDMAQQEQRIAGGGNRRSGAAPISTSGQDVDEWETVPSSRRGGKAIAGGSMPSTPSRGQGAGGGTGNSSSAADRRDRNRGAKGEAEWRKVQKATPPEILKPSTPSTSTPSKGRSLLELSSQTKLGPSNASFGAASSSAAREEKKAKEFQKEVSSVLKELAVSHDLDDALARVREAGPLPAKHQKDSVCKVVSSIVDSSSSGRPCLWSFLTQLLKQGVFQKSALLEGLDGWIASESYEDLKMDLPKLDEILEKECLNKLLEEDVLSSAEVEKLQQKLNAS
eukprot:TRINITY_DN41525_c0_g1_i1.p1 TRINITY_DN41525_c0_g1~~TRINITY_DN41525_c0_g1_i1.p1  ORF type:complete len:1220 (+),score=343.80 TRINITY_DN41525_c0_g1_i1:129-3788(+)